MTICTSSMLSIQKQLTKSFFGNFIIRILFINFPFWEVHDNSGQSLLNVLNQTCIVYRLASDRPWQLMFLFSSRNPYILLLLVGVDLSIRSPSRQIAGPHADTQNKKLS